MSSFYNSKDLFYSSIKSYKNFSFLQEEIVMEQILNNKKISFAKKQVNYICSFEKEENFDKDKPTLLIPIKNNSELLKYTIKNLQKTGISKLSNIIIIDDRSEEDLREIVGSNKFSYLRVDNDKGFNFSMLNNIAAKICLDLHVKQIILWNSDLWCAKPEYFLEILRRHKKNNADMCGAKLVYPPLEMSINKEIDTKNINESFPQFKDGKWRETVQFGGDAWILSEQTPLRVIPFHFRRFEKIDNPLVNCDRGANFITGAFQLWNLETFIQLGGLNPSLSKNFQDVDISLRASEAGKRIFYFGKDLYFYHDESFTMHNLKDEKKDDKQMISDRYLFGKLWNDKAVKMVF